MAPARYFVTGVLQDISRAGSQAPPPRQARRAPNSGRGPWAEGSLAVCREAEEGVLCRVSTNLCHSTQMEDAAEDLGFEIYLTMPRTPVT